MRFGAYWESFYDNECDFKEKEMKRYVERWKDVTWLRLGYCFGDLCYANNVLNWKIRDGFEQEVFSFEVRSFTV